MGRGQRFHWITIYEPHFNPVVREIETATAFDI